jgi:hypothetical protein
MKKTHSHSFNDGIDLVPPFGSFCLSWIKHDPMFDLSNVVSTLSLGTGSDRKASDISRPAQTQARTMGWGIQGDCASEKKPPDEIRRRRTGSYGPEPHRGRREGLDNHPGRSVDCAHITFTLTLLYRPLPSGSAKMILTSSFTDFKN